MALFLQSGNSKSTHFLLSMGIVLEEERGFVEFCFVLRTVSWFFLPFLLGANLSEENHKVQAKIMKRKEKKESAHKLNLSPYEVICVVLVPHHQPCPWGTPPKTLFRTYSTPALEEHGVRPCSTCSVLKESCGLRFCLNDFSPSNPPKLSLFGFS